MLARFTTIGHSNRSLGDFLGMLHDARVALVIDIRAFPHSRNNPDYSIDRLPAALAQTQIDYRHLRALGGRRKKQPGIDEGLNGWWRHESFQNYADYALGDEFATAFDEMVRLGCDQRLALMCSEAVWWRCHRRIITDHLLMSGHEVDHIMAPGRIEHASPTPGAYKTSQGKVIYPLVLRGR